jgi:hypothetical protein
MKTTGMVAISAAALMGMISLLYHSRPASPIDPLSDPDKAAWELFVQVNSPSDINEDIVSWETWTPAARVFANAKIQPQVSANVSGKFELSKSIRDELSSSPPDLTAAFKDAQPQLCSDDLKDHGNQVMLNDAMVDYIAQNKLYNVEGQIAASKNGEIQFPPESVAVKAVWEPIDPKNADQFYSRQCGHSWYGLVALHVTSKRTKDWLWTTFEHTKIDEKHNKLQCQKIDCVDTFGASPPRGFEHQQTPQLISLFSQLSQKWQSVWSHYRLIGTQVKFIDAKDKPLKMGNSILEAGVIETSSCITCHSRSTISEDKTRLRIGQSDNTGFLGTPEPCWYIDQARQVKFYKLDYVWSLSLAQRKDGVNGGAPPSSLNCGGKEAGGAGHSLRKTTLSPD